MNMFIEEHRVNKELNSDAKKIGAFLECWLIIVFKKIQRNPNLKADFCGIWSIVIL